MGWSDVPAFVPNSPCLPAPFKKLKIVALAVVAQAIWGMAKICVPPCARYNYGSGKLRRADVPQCQIVVMLMIVAATVLSALLVPHLVRQR